MIINNLYKFKDKRYVFFTGIKKDNVSIQHKSKIVHMTLIQVVQPHITCLNDKFVYDELNGGIVVDKEKTNFIHDEKHEFKLLCSASNPLNHLKLDNKPQRYLQGKYKTFFMLNKNINIDNNLDEYLNYLQNFTNVKLISSAKGRGTVGVMQLYGFKGLPASHGVSLAHRHAGSTGRDIPRKLYPGVEAPKKAGNGQVTNYTRIFKMNKKYENNKVIYNILVFGPVAGKIGTIISLGIKK